MKSTTVPGRKLAFRKQSGRGAERNGSRTDAAVSCLPCAISPWTAPGHRKRPTIMTPGDSSIRRDLMQLTLGVLFIVGLLVAALWIMRPFLVPIVWAAMIAIATWPLMLRIERLFGRRRWLAVVVMTVAMLLVFVVPFWVAVSTIVEYSDDIQGWAKSLREIHLPMPPDWVGRLPLARPRIASTSGPITRRRHRKRWRQSSRRTWGNHCGGWRPRPEASDCCSSSSCSPMIIFGDAVCKRRDGGSMA